MKQTDKSIFTPAQKSVIEKLRMIGHLATSPSRGNLKLATRTNTLITGPSGSGKSFIAKALAAELRVPLWEINVSAWIVLGARNDSPTLASLCNWVSRNTKGIIFIDELEKPFPYSSDGNGSSEWYNTVRMELHDILDSRMPVGGILVDDETINTTYKGLLSNHECKEIVKIDVESKLRDSFLIVGAGTWQHLWTKNQRSLGFRGDSVQITTLDQGQLLKSISPEILLRFRGEVLFLRPMTEADFRQVLDDRTALVPVNYRKRFSELVHAAIPKALEYGLGMRVLEEVFTNLCIEIIHDCDRDQGRFREIVLGDARECSI